MKRVLLPLVFLFVASCAYKSASMPGMMIPGRIGMEELTRDDYVVMGPAEGRGCASWTALFPLPIWWTSDDGTSGDLFGWDEGGRAEGSAIYAAIESVPNADAILSPRFHEEGQSGGIWYHEACVTAKGKAIRIKSDDERAPAPSVKKQAAAPASVKKKTAAKKTVEENDQAADKETWDAGPEDE